MLNNRANDLDSRSSPAEDPVCESLAVWSCRSSMRFARSHSALLRGSCLPFPELVPCLRAGSTNSHTLFPPLLQYPCWSVRCTAALADRGSFTPRMSTLIKLELSISKFRGQLWSSEPDEFPSQIFFPRADGCVLNHVVDRSHVLGDCNIHCLTGVDTDTQTNICPMGKKAPAVATLEASSRDTRVCGHAVGRE